MDEISHVYVFSNQNNLPYETIKSLEDIPGLGPDYVVIASPTDQHDPQLKFLEEHLQGKKIMVEKPLFDSMVEFTVRNNEVVVGYNLRFHPLLNKIRELCQGRRLWNIHVICGSYLPDWRPGRDYRATSSARKDSGGGVLLDLSHELDYVQWLVGSMEVDHAASEKVSDLEIDSDDLLLLSGKTRDDTYVHISLNYFTRNPLRQILIDGEGISIQGDLNTNQLSVVEDGEASDYSWPNLKQNDTYRAQHKVILEGDLSRVCTFEEGVEIMRLIENIRAWRN
jgi:CMP-N,N'-diacetyllegionaminic acid synthase